MAGGLPLFGETQLAVETTLVSSLRSDGSARRRAVERDGVALEAARQRTERTYPEWVGAHRRARLVVIAIEVGGRWSDETWSFLSQLAKAKDREETRLLGRRVEQAWRLRWGSMLSCAAGPGSGHVVARAARSTRSGWGDPISGRRGTGVPVCQPGRVRLGFE